MRCLSVLEKNGESETPSPRLRSLRRVLENFRSFAKSFVVSTFTTQKKPVGWLAEISLVAGVGIEPTTFRLWGRLFEPDSAFRTQKGTFSCWRHMKKHIGSIVKKGNYYHWRYRDVNGRTKSKVVKNSSGGKVLDRAEAELICWTVGKRLVRTPTIEK